MDALDQFLRAGGFAYRATRNADHSVYYEISCTTLEYAIHADLTHGSVSIGCNTKGRQPFGADSLFEVNVVCDHLEWIAKYYFADDRTWGAVVGHAEINPIGRLKVIEILIRPGGDLSIWPCGAFRIMPQ